MIFFMQYNTVYYIVLPSGIYCVVNDYYHYSPCYSEKGQILTFYNCISFHLKSAYNVSQDILHQIALFQ